MFLVDSPRSKNNCIFLQKWCDEYFYIPARGEHRGIGGIFFDDLEAIRHTDNIENAGSAERTAELDKAMEFTQSVCQAFMPSYLPIVRKRRELR